MSIHENIKPTRMELKNIKEHLELTTNGFELLKNKNDALINELSNIRRDINSKKKELQNQMNEAYNNIDIASSKLGLTNIKYLAVSTNDAKNITLKDKKIMGVKVKQITFEKFERNFVERGYNIYDSNISLDNAALSFEKALPHILEIGEKKHNIITISDEVKKTNRKVNSLESIILPELRKTIKTITGKIAEREREEFIRIKKVKSWISR
ncbi:MAG: V-type ATP synthase subunit D [DPANN group archaeon]|nr:V-type ATP synthase subunit D [DPANN group archaeon]